MQGNPGHQPQLVGFFGDPFKRQDFHAAPADAALDHAQVIHGHEAAGDLAAGRSLAPDGARRRPERVFKQKLRRLPRAETDEIGAVGGAHGRQHERHPVGILLQIVLLFLRRRVGRPVADHRQFGEFRNAELDGIGRLAQQVTDDDLLRGGRAGADLLHAMAHPHLAVGIEFQRQRGGIRAGAVILLRLREADAVQPAGVGPVELGLGFVPVRPQRMLCRDVEHFNIARLAERLSALGVFETGPHRIAAAQFDLINAQFGGDFIDHQLRDAHGLKGAVAAHGPRLHRGRCQRDGRKIGFREIIDGLRGGGGHLRDREGEIGAAAAIEIIEALEDLELAALAVGHDGHVHFDGVALDAELELLIAVVGKPYRQAVPIETRRDDIEREDRMVLGPVPHGGAREQLDRPDREALVVLDHQRRDAGDLIRRLRRRDQVQGARFGIIPGIAVVRLQRARVD